jgi:serine/threonine protein kinase
MLRILADGKHVCAVQEELVTLTNDHITSYTVLVEHPDANVETAIPKLQKLAKEEKEALAFYYILQALTINAIFKCKNVYFGDFKPSSLLLTHDHRVKVADFSLSTIISPDSTEPVYSVQGFNKDYVAAETLDLLS